MKNETVTIPKELYESLLEDKFFLQCLENAGVDNWAGYEYAQQEFQQWNEE